MNQYNQYAVKFTVSIICMQVDDYISVLHNGYFHRQQSVLSLATINVVEKGTISFNVRYA